MSNGVSSRTHLPDSVLQTYYVYYMALYVCSVFLKQHYVRQVIPNILHIFKKEKLVCKYESKYMYLLVFLVFLLNVKPGPVYLMVT